MIDYSVMICKLRALKFKILYKYLLRPILFLQDPEKVHDQFIRFGRFLGKHQITKTLTRWLFSCQNPALEQNIAGITFKNPVGLSTGFDKDANLVNILPNVGFGFMQIGTVTYEPYRGNPKPRLYRLLRSRGLVVYYGLKNIGVKKIIEKLRKTRASNFPLGLSVGKTNSPKTVAIKAGIDDYYNCLKQFIDANVGDFYTINISCPNTFGGEPFTTPEELSLLLEKIYTLNINKPVFLKMPIDLGWSDFKKLLDIAVRFKVDGVIIGNVTKNRKGGTIKDKIPPHVKGGVSGKPTWRLSNGLIFNTYKNYGDKLIIIGVGGIFSAEDAYEKIKRGSSLVQLITGMVYEGPQLIGEINRGLAEFLKRDGYTNIQQAVGAYHK